MAVDTTILNRYLDADELYVHHTALAKAAKDERDGLAEFVIQMLSMEGLKHISLKRPDGSARTVHVTRNLWAGHNGDEQALCEALKDSGYLAYVKEKYNVQSLSSLVRELASEYHQKPVAELTVEQMIEALPEKVRENIKVSEVFNVGNKKSG